MPSTHISLSYHIVFSTKNRDPLIAPPWRNRLHDMLGGCIRRAGGAAIQIGGTADHVHLFAGLRATHCLADFVRDVKRATSAWVHDTLRVGQFAWQEGYGAFTVSPYDCDELVNYIRTQEEHHRSRTFQDEYREFLKRHEIEFDERYLW